MPICDPSIDALKLRKQQFEIELKEAIIQLPQDSTANRHYVQRLSKAYTSRERTVSKQFVSSIKFKKGEQTTSRNSAKQVFQPRLP